MRRHDVCFLSLIRVFNMISYYGLIDFQKWVLDSCVIFRIGLFHLCFQYRLYDIEKMTVLVTSLRQFMVSLRVVTQTNV